MADPLALDLPVSSPPLPSANLASLPLRPLAKPEPEGIERKRYRTIWISDVHLGTKGCNAELLIDFLDHTDSDTMYPVGDIIDGWRLKKKWHKKSPQLNKGQQRRVLRGYAGPRAGGARSFGSRNAG